MKEWSTSIEINAAIEDVWKIIDGSEENLKKLDPKIVSSIVIEETPERIGSKYRQQYKEGKRVIEYIVEVKEYDEDDKNKKFKIGFNLAGWFDITAKYELKRMDNKKTYLTYTTTNKPLKFFAKLMMFFMRNDSVVDKHVNRLKDLSETVGE